MVFSDHSEKDTWKMVKLNISDSGVVQSQSSYPLSLAFSRNLTPIVTTTQQIENGTQSKYKKVMFIHRGNTWDPYRPNSLQQLGP